MFAIAKFGDLLIISRRCCCWAIRIYVVALASLIGAHTTSLSQLELQSCVKCMSIFVQIDLDLKSQVFLIYCCCSIALNPKLQIGINPNYKTFSLVTIIVNYIIWPFCC